jgi:P-type conjugative transfer protein TrbG
MRTAIVFALSAFALSGAAAQTNLPPAQFPDRPPPSMPMFTGPNPPLSMKESKAVAIGKEWADNRAGPARGAEGATVFIFGSTLPTIVCAPLYVCDLALQEGEAVNDLNVGDSVRWKITPATQGAGESLVTHVMIKPADIGLITNLVITTNRRTYIIKLVSRAQDWMPRIGFQYPDDVDSQWKAYRAKFEETRAAAPALLKTAAAKTLNFDYLVSGDAAWKPTRVYTDGLKTYIQFPPNVGSTDLPALAEVADDESFLQIDSLINGPTLRLVNYRYIDHRFEVDKVLAQARLTSGTGDAATIVTIKRWKNN